MSKSFEENMEELEKVVAELEKGGKPYGTTRRSGNDSLDR